MATATIRKIDLEYKLRASWFSPNIKGGAVCIPESERRKPDVSPVLYGYVALCRGQYYLIGDVICYSHKHGGLILHAEKATLEAE